MLNTTLVIKMDYRHHHPVLICTRPRHYDATASVTKKISFFDLQHSVVATFQIATK